MIIVVQTVKNSLQHLSQVRIFCVVIGSKPGYAWLDYLDDNNFIEDTRGRMQSPLITGPRCMTFYFHLYGNKTGFFDIETKLLRSGSTPKLIFRRYGNHGMTWQRAQVYINITEDYRVT